MSTAAKTIREMDADARALILAAKPILESPEDHTPEAIEGAMKSLEEAEKIGAELDRHRNNKDALKTLNRLENSVSELREVNRPAFGGSPNAGAHGHARNDHRGHDLDALKTAGDLVVENDAFSEWAKAVAPFGEVAKGKKIASPQIEVKTLYTLSGDNTASRPLLGQADRRPDMMPALGWPMRVLRDVMTVLTTTSDLVEFPRELSRTNNADFVAEATATSGSVGEKPESALTFELVQTAVQTIAHWIPATSRVLSDARMLRQIIDAFLREGLQQKAEAAFLTGSGTSPEIRGIYNTSGILTQTYATSILATTRKARTKLRITGRAIPNAWVMNPSDWETLDLSMDGQNRFYWGGPIETGTPRLWGVPIVESEFATAVLPLLGNFRDAVVFDREQTGISVSNEHADFFIRNLVAILAEMRAAFIVRRPSSFCTVALA
jgi:HK97 family phage major capsid protein